MHECRRLSICNKMISKSTKKTSIFQRTLGSVLFGPISKITTQIVRWQATGYCLLRVSSGSRGRQMTDEKIVVVVVNQ